MISPNINDTSTFITSANVSGLQYTVDQFGDQIYASGGILQYACVTADLATGLPGDIRLPTAANVMPLGIALDSAVGPRQPVMVQLRGRAKCRAFSAIAVGDALVVADTSGRVATISMTGGATDTPIVGYAASPATQQDDILIVDLRIGSYTTVTTL